MLTPSPWESGWLGKAAYALRGERPPPPEELGRALEALPRPAFVSARVEATDRGWNRCLQRAGFAQIEAYLVLARRVEQLPPPRMQAGVTLATGDHLPGLREIARASFEHDRFHRDPLIPADLADRSRELWVENALVEEAKTVIVAGDPCEGFLIGCPGDDAATYVLDLMAVAGASRGRGVGRALTLHFFLLAVEAGARRVVVGTQDINTPSLNLYLSCGFRHERVSYTYHLHLDA